MLDRFNAFLNQQQFKFTVIVRNTERYSGEWDTNYDTALTAAITKVVEIYNGGK